MSAASPAVPLTEAELDRLEGLLAVPESDEGALPLDALQGFLCAVCSAPQEIPQQVWVSAALGESPATDEVVDLLVRFKNSIGHSLQMGESVNLILYPMTEDDADDLDYETWTQGYVEGMDICETAWEEAAPDEEELDDLLMNILVLSGALEEDEDLRAELGLNAREEAKLIRTYTERLPDVVQEIYDYWTAIRLKPETFTREGPRIGRNDPCPCGSGKKYKHCHGTIQ